MSVLIFIIVLLVVVLIHEWGHFMAAKRVGMRVDEFGFGFPPRLFGIQKGETLYSLNVLPIGGFVRIFGEDAVLEGEKDKNDAGRAFTSKSKLAQIFVLAAGVLMNIVLAWALFSAVLFMGDKTVVSEGEASPNAELLVTEVLPESPAGLSGIPRGAEIVAIGTASEQQVIMTSRDFQEFTARHIGEQIIITYRVGDEEQSVSVSSEQGVIPGSEDVYAVGVGLALVDTVRLPIHKAIIEGAVMTGEGLVAITKGITGLLVDAVRFEADFSEVAGPVGIVGLVGEASSFGPSSLLMFVAFISLNLAIINLIPFPALDGGRILFVIIEAIKGAPIKPSWVMILNTAGFALLILLMVAVTYNDILRIV